MSVYKRQEWLIWVCRCPGRFWAKKPHQVTCAQCGHVTIPITVVQGSVKK